jgi:hypothetical protein
MTPKALKETLASLVNQKLPAFIWGPSGIGKSAIVQEIAHDLGVRFLDLHLTLLDPSDLKGIPFLKDDEAIWASPSFLPKKDRKGGILFLDEFNAASASVQAAAYQLILNRRIGEYILPDNWAIVASGHRDSDHSISHEIPLSLANHFVHFDMEYSISDWRDWAFREKVHDSIIAFISLHHDALFQFDPSSEEKAYPTPRSWEHVDTILKSKMSEEHLYDAISGAIGPKYASKFLTFKQQSCELPVFQEIFEGRCKYYPEDLCALHVAVTVLVSNALRKPNKQVLNHLLRYTLDLEADFALMIIKDLESQGITFDRLEAWKTWSEKFLLTD